MQAVVSVVGKDKVGIIAKVSGLLAELKINIQDISQTILQSYFTMIMMVDTKECEKEFDEISKTLEAEGEKNDLAIRIQRVDIFNAMHKL